MFKRIVLFLVTNLAIIIVISLILSIFNVSPYLTQYGLNYQALLIFAAIIGFTGAFISLFISKWMAIHAFNVQLIEKPTTESELWLMNEVRSLAQKEILECPMLESTIVQSPMLLLPDGIKTKLLLPFQLDCSMQ